MLRIALLMSILAATSSATAQTEVIGFEGTTTTGINRQLDAANADMHGPSLVDYAGYDWVGWNVNKPLVVVNRPQQITGVVIDPEDGPTFETQVVDAGFHRSLVSGDTIGFINGFGSVKARTGEDNFNLVSAYMTSAWREDLDVTVMGLRDGVTVYTQNLVLSQDGPTLYSFNFADIDEVRFSGSGGSFLYANGATVGAFVNPSGAFSAPMVAFDNLTISAVPEPATLAMLLSGLSVVGWFARGKKHSA